MASSPLYLDRPSPVHRLAPETKIAAALLYTIVVVLTPREELLAFAGYALLLVPVAALARVRPLWLAKRAAIELPFIALAVALPFAGGGERVSWLGMSLSADGLYGGWNIVAKGTLGVLASLLLAATTSPRDLLLGLGRLRCPHVITQIATFMLRYLAVLAGEAQRMRIARISRGDDPRFLWQARAFATGIGALFIRSFERGERVYLAMIGYNGRLPDLGGAAGGLWLGAPAATGTQWAAAAALPAMAGAIAAVTVLS
jgi:cobalt/nickel transport system permease protein